MVKETGRRRPGDCLSTFLKKRKLVFSNYTLTTVCPLISRSVDLEKCQMESERENGKILLFRKRRLFNTIRLIRMISKIERETEEREVN